VCRVLRVKYSGLSEVSGVTSVTRIPVNGYANIEDVELSPKEAFERKARCFCWGNKRITGSSVVSLAQGTWRVDGKNVPEVCAGSFDQKANRDGARGISRRL